MCTGRWFSMLLLFLPEKKCIITFRVQKRGIIHPLPHTHNSFVCVPCVKKTWKKLSPLLCFLFFRTLMHMISKKEMRCIFFSSSVSKWSCTSALVFPGTFRVNIEVHTKWGGCLVSRKQSFPSFPSFSSCRLSKFSRKVVHWFIKVQCWFPCDFCYTRWNSWYHSLPKSNMILWNKSDTKTKINFLGRSQTVIKI